MEFTIITVVSFLALVLSTLVFLARRYQRCPSDKILVIFGRVGGNQAARCIHGGGTLVLPLIQDFSYLSLTPMTMSIPLQNALSLQNIRIHVPSTFTVGISTAPHIMANAAERLLGLNGEAIEDMAKEIIFGQLRLTVASLTIEQINQDRERFLEEIRKNVEPELNKIGLYLINVNITDITDESDYIESIGKKAASEAINRAMIDVAEQEKVGKIGQSESHRERDIRVAENLAESNKGQKKAAAEERIYLQQQESRAAIGEAKADLEREVSIAESQAETAKGKKRAESEQRIYIQEQEAVAIDGECQSQARIAEAQALLEQKRAESYQSTEVARKNADAIIQKAKYAAEMERLKSEEIAIRQIEKEKIEILAQAEANKVLAEAKSKAEATQLDYDAQAGGISKVLESKAKGYRSLIESCKGDPKAAATFLMIEKMDEMVKTQVEAIKNLKIDKITVWDSASGEKGSATSNFVSSLIKSLPPIHDIAKMAGVELPNYFGRLKQQSDKPKTPKNGKVHNEAPPIAPEA